MAGLFKSIDKVSDWALLTTKFHVSQRIARIAKFQFYTVQIYNLGIVLFF